MLNYSSLSSSSSVTSELSRLIFFLLENLGKFSVPSGLKTDELPWLRCANPVEFMEKLLANRTLAVSLIS